MAIRRRPALTPQEQTDLGFGSVVARQDRVRLMNRDGSFNARRDGVPLADRLSPYHALLTMSWPVFLALFFAFYILVNAIFGAIYWSLGPAALSAPGLAPMGGRYIVAFFFSVETFATIGYGNILPNGLLANAIVFVESVAGILTIALATGLIFARFSRPSLHIRFSKSAIIAPYRGGTGLMFRIGNQRSTELVNVRANVTFARFEVCDGVRTRVFDTLALERSSVLFFALTWTIVHPIVEGSPFYGLTQADLLEAEAELLIILQATDETFSQEVHTRASYQADEFQWGVKFASVYTDRDARFVRVDLRRIDDVEPAPLPAAATTADSLATSAAVTRP